MEDFVTYEIAVKLKEKGFKLACIGHYEGERFEYNTYDGHDIDISYIARSYNDDNRFDEYTDLPVISEVLKWLREEKHLHIHIEYIFSEDTLWICEVQILGSYERFYPDGDFDTYEQAALAGVNYCLENLI